MKVQPDFTGKIRITTVKNEQYAWADYKTSPQNDAKILKLADKIFSYGYPIVREPVDKKGGDKLVALLEKSISNKIDLPEKHFYTYKRGIVNNQDTGKTTNHILLLGEEDTQSLKMGDRTGISIWI